MFDLSWGKLVLIGMVALIAIGPKELPGVLRSVGQWMTKLRRMAAEFQGQFQEAMREAEMADLKKQVEGLADPIKSFTDLNPLETTRKELETTFEEKFTAPADAAAPAATEPSPVAESSHVAASSPTETAPAAPAETVASADAPPAVPAEAVTQAPLDDAAKPQVAAAVPEATPQSAGRAS